jgi:hypothetical protein
LPAPEVFACTADLSGIIRDDTGGVDTGNCRAIAGIHNRQAKAQSICSPLAQAKSRR